MSGDSHGHLQVSVVTYGGEQSARKDMEVVEQLYTEGSLNLYDLALVVKDADGEVREVRKTEKSTEHAAEGGAVIGGLLGLIFPPALLAVVGGAAIGAAYGGIAGHLWRGMSRKDLHELGEHLDRGRSALVIVADERLTETATEKLAADAEVVSRSTGLTRGQLAAMEEDARPHGFRMEGLDH